MKFNQKHKRDVDKSMNSGVPKEKGKRLFGREVGGCVATYCSPTTSGTPEAEDIDLILGTGPTQQLQGLDGSNSEDEGPLRTIKLSATKETLGGGVGMPKGFVGSKNLNPEDTGSVFRCVITSPLRTWLAVDTASQRCYESVVSKLAGEGVGAFSIVTSTSKQALQGFAAPLGTASRRHTLE